MVTTIHLRVQKRCQIFLCDEGRLCVAPGCTISEAALGHSVLI